MNKPIKVIKRTADLVQQNTPVDVEHSTRRQTERDLRKAVGDWIEERRVNREIQTEIANSHLRASRPTAHGSLS